MNRAELFSALHPGGKCYPYQIQWAKDRGLYKLGVKARQIGITTSEAIDNFMECLMWKESEKQPNPPVIAFLSPSQRQSARLMDYIQRAKARYEKIFDTRVELKKEREDRLQFDNFAELFSLPNNPRTVEGLDVSKGIIDEAGNFVGREDYQIYESLMGSLAAKGGSLTIFGAPRGRRGLFWELANPYGEYASKFSTHLFKWNVRGDVDPKYAKSVLSHKERMSPMAFAENYECEFVDEGIVVFGYDLLDAQSREYELWTSQTKYTNQNLIYMGIDFGRRINRSVVTAVEVVDKKIITRFQEESNAPYDKQIEWINSLINNFNPYRVNVDLIGPGIPLYDFLQSKHHSLIEGINLTSQMKEKLVTTAHSMMQEDRLIIPKHITYKDLITQLHGIEREVLDSGKSRYSGKHTETDWQDDRAWSLFLAICSIGTSEFKFMVLDSDKKNLNPYERFLRDEE